MDRITRYGDASCFFCPVISSLRVVPASKQSLAKHVIRHPNVMRQNCRPKTKLGKFMTDDQEKKCHAIIHSHAVAAAAGNAVPVPGLGIAADMVTMTSMTMSLCAVFGGSLTEEAAKALAIATIKNTMLKQPIKTLTKELSKFIPFLGQVVAPSISVVMLEAAGWTLAKELEAKFRAKAA